MKVKIDWDIMSDIINNNPVVNFIVNIIMTAWYILSYANKKYFIPYMIFEILFGFCMVLHYNGENVYAF